MSVPPLLYALLLPLLVAFGCAGLLRRRGRKARGKAPAGRDFGGAIVALAFLAGFAALAGGLPFVGNVVHHRVGEIACFLWAGAALLALWMPGPRLLLGLVLGEAVLAIFWQLGLADLADRDLLIGIGAAIVGMLVLRRLLTLAPSGAAAPLILGLAAAALALLADAMRTGLAGDLAWALAASLAGWLAWARPFNKGEAGAALVLVGGGLLVAVAFAVSHSALRAPWAPLLLVPAFWPEALAARLPMLAGRLRRKADRPMAYLAASAVPIALVALGALILA